MKISIDEQISCLETIGFLICNQHNSLIVEKLDAAIESLHELKAQALPINAGDITPESCAWSQDAWDDLESNTYNTSCGEIFALIEGKPSENNMNYCCYCGKPLVEHPYVEPESNDDE